MLLPGGAAASTACALEATTAGRSSDPCDWQRTDSELLQLGLLRSRLHRTAWLDVIRAEHAAVRQSQGLKPSDLG